MPGNAAGSPGREVMADVVTAQVVGSPDISEVSNGGPGGEGGVDIGGEGYPDVSCLVQCNNESNFRFGSLGKGNELL